MTYDLRFMIDDEKMPEPSVIYEDKDFLILNKPAGLLVHESGIRNKESGIRENKEETLVDWLVKKYPEVKKVGDAPEVRPGIVHRLDRATSGIMVVPRTQEYFLYLKSLFSAGGACLSGRQGPSSGGQPKIQKTYLALVFGKFKESKGEISKPIGIKSGTTKRSVHSKKMVKEAVTEYKLVSCSTYHVSGKVLAKREEKRQVESQQLSLLEVYPKTGRTHQIRVHLSSIGHPVVGDELYGKSKKKLEVPRLMLHALSLEFSSREGEKLKFEAEVPEDFKRVLANPSTGSGYYR